jgi:hypothetical protein
MAPLLLLLLQVLADVKKVITDEDLLGLVSDNMDTADAAGWEVIDLHVSCSMGWGGGRVLGDRDFQFQDAGNSVVMLFILFV